MALAFRLRSKRKFFKNSIDIKFPRGRKDWAMDWDFFSFVTSCKRTMEKLNWTARWAEAAAFVWCFR